MKKPIAIRSNNYLFNSLLIFSGITFMLVWLPLLRCLFDGISYSWGQSYFGIQLSSTGVQTDYFALIPFLLMFILFFYSFYWIKNRTIFYGLMFLWWVHTFGNLLYDLIKNGDTKFHGDTLNVHISLSMIIIPLSLVALLLIVLIIFKDKKLNEVSVPWSKKNKRMALIILGMIPIQGVMFATGEPHGLTDEISVIIAILQSFLLPTIFFPKRVSTSPAA